MAKKVEDCVLQKQNYDSAWGSISMKRNWRKPDWAEEKPNSNVGPTKSQMTFTELLNKRFPIRLL